VNDELRFRLLKVLTQAPDISQRELAGRLGLSLGKTNYCVRALIDKGWVKVRNFTNSKHKLAYAYVLTPTGLRARAKATLDFLRRKQAEYAQLEVEIAELRHEAQQLAGGGRSAPGAGR
jgi:EPS-associated MarR family transcriptional regulator